jgi:cytochrome b561
MTNEEAILRVLTELRDMQREDIAYRRQLAEQSLRMQRSAARVQRLALIVLAIALAIGAYFLMSARYGRVDEPDSQGDVWERGKR